MSCQIRTETPGDAAAVRSLVARAFQGAEFSAPPVEADGVPGEATLVGWLRDSPAHDPRFALTAFDGPALVGCAVATWGDCAGTPLLGIGPVAVDPDRQGEGIGTALMQALTARAAESGEPAVVLLGDPAFYARFGFIPASRLGITADPAWGDYFQALPLRRDGASDYQGPSGHYEYAEPFSRLG